VIDPEPNWQSFASGASRIRTPVAVLAGWKIALVLAGALLALLFFVSLFVSASTSAIGSRQLCGPAPGARADIPPAYIPWLERAATRYGLGARGVAIIAAVH